MLFFPLCRRDYSQKGNHLCLAWYLMIPNTFQGDGVVVPHLLSSSQCCARALSSSLSSSMLRALTCSADPATMRHSEDTKVRGGGWAVIEGVVYLQSPDLELFASPEAPAGEFAGIPGVSPYISTASPSLSAVCARYYGLTSHRVIQSARNISASPQRLRI